MLCKISFHVHVFHDIQLAVGMGTTVDQLMFTAINVRVSAYQNILPAVNSDFESQQIGYCRSTNVRALLMFANFAIW